jgi:hypothetical protein
MQVRLAAAVILLQALGLVVAASVLVVKSIVGEPDSYARALLGAVLALGGAALFAAAARGILRGSSAARSPVVVIELLWLPVAYSLTFTSDQPLYGAPLLVTAVAVLYLLFTPAAREMLDRG